MNTIEPQTPSQLQESILPTSYVLWLTWRSQFLDILAEKYKDLDINDRFKEFEAESIDKLEREVTNERPAEQP